MAARSTRPRYACKLRHGSKTTQHPTSQMTTRLARLSALPMRVPSSAFGWARTPAWAGADGTLYLNIAGREAQGTIPNAETEFAAQELAARLRALGGTEPADTPPNAADPHPTVEVYPPAALYSTVRGV